MVRNTQGAFATPLPAARSQRRHWKFVTPAEMNYRPGRQPPDNEPMYQSASPMAPSMTRAECEGGST